MSLLDKYISKSARLEAGRQMCPNCTTLMAHDPQAGEDVFRCNVCGGHYCIREITSPAVGFKIEPPQKFEGFLYSISSLPLFLQLSQFVIDWFEERLDAILQLESDADRSEESLWAGFSYQVENLLQIINPDTVDGWFLAVTNHWAKKRAGLNDE